MPFSPLDKGFHKGKIDETTTFDSSDFRNIVPRFSAENRKPNHVVVDLLTRIATEKREALDGNAVDWIKMVSDEQYQIGPPRR